jgi:hypothetical protein
MIHRSTLALADQQLEMRVLSRGHELYERRIARLESRLEAAEKEWKDNPRRYAMELECESVVRRAARPAPVPKKVEATHRVSAYGVMFKLRHDGLDNWRKKFLGSPKEAALRGRDPRFCNPQAK